MQRGDRLVALVNGIFQVTKIKCLQAWYILSLWLKSYSGMWISPDAKDLGVPAPDSSIS